MGKRHYQEIWEAITMNFAKGKASGIELNTTVECRPEQLRTVLRMVQKEKWMAANNDCPIALYHRLTSEVKRTESGPTVILFKLSEASTRTAGLYGDLIANRNKRSNNDDTPDSK